MIQRAVKAWAETHIDAIHSARVRYDANGDRSKVHQDN